MILRISEYDVDYVVKKLATDKDYFESLQSKIRLGGGLNNFYSSIHNDFGGSDKNQKAAALLTLGCIDKVVSLPWVGPKAEWRVEREFSNISDLYLAMFRDKLSDEGEKPLFDKIMKMTKGQDGLYESLKAYMLVDEQLNGK